MCPFGDTHWSDKCQNRATSDARDVHEEVFAFPQPCRIILGDIIEFLRKFHLNEVDDFVGTLDDEINLGTFTGVALARYKTP